LVGEETLPDFQDWLVGATWDVEEQRKPQAIDMTYEIKLALAEHSRGDISLSEVRQRLSELVQTSEKIQVVGAA
jgi:hypothetical protein